MALERKENHLPLIYNVKFDQNDHMVARNNAYKLAAEIGRVSYSKTVKEARCHLMALQQQSYPLVAYSYQMRNRPDMALLEIFLVSAMLYRSFGDLQLLPPFPIRFKTDLVACFIFVALCNIYFLNVAKRICEKFFTNNDGPKEPRQLLTEALSNSIDGFFRGNQPRRVGNSIPLSYYNIEILSGPQLLELYQQLFPGDLLQLPQAEVPKLT